jgi:mRNA interferase RelE/StbE
MTGQTSRGAATQLYSAKFDDRFFALPVEVQIRVQARMDDMGLRLRNFPHYKMQGASTYRLRVGDYRVIYQFDIARNEIFFVALGHRREIYKS